MAEMEKKKVNAMGDECPVPLVKAKNAIAELAGSGKVEVLVDNEIAVQNLEKMAQQKGYGFLVKEKKEKEYHVEFTVSETEPAETEEKTVCLVPAAKKTKLVVLSADHMGEGAEEQGKILILHGSGADLESAVIPNSQDMAVSMTQAENMVN